MNVFETLESQVRSYSRSWPAVFDRARGSTIDDERGRRYVDFFAGAGALNYGHNHPVLKRALISYLVQDRVVHSLDMSTVARRAFLETFDALILRPRGLRYRIQFPGPGGANAVEAALKLARKATGRTEVLSFANAFHGMSVGALSVTGNAQARRGAGMPLHYGTVLPYDDAGADCPPDFSWFDKLLGDSSSGLDRPAAVIVESVQGEGGINLARPQWLQALAGRCRELEILLIVDDVQMGCGRTGPFFSFESAGLVPDLVCLSKSLSGYGIPLALTLIREDLDVWEPGQHSGTFRGVNPALITATEALRTFWSDDALQRTVAAHAQRIRAALSRSCDALGLQVRGRGMAQAVVMPSGEQAARARTAAFEAGLLVETAGSENEVLKLMPALTIPPDQLDQGLALLERAIRCALG